MALQLADRVQQTGTANTTVSFNLSGSVSGYQSFSSAITTGNTTYYAASDGTNWEVGVGTLTSSSLLTRTTIISSSNSGSAVSTFGSSINIFVTQPAENTVVSSNNPGTTGTVLTSNGTGVAPSWAAVVNSFSAGSTGLTPSTASTGAVTLAGTLAVGSGGTGAATLAANNVLLGNGTSALQVVAPGTSGNLLTSNGTTWSSTAPPASGASLSNDTSTATNLYPIFAAATSGTPTTIYTSNAKYLYKPSTGELQAPEVVANNGFILNATTLVSSYTIPAGFNASTVGQFTIPSGLSVTVTSGQRWVIL